LTEAASVDELLPLLGFTESQLPPDDVEVEAVKVKVLPPLDTDSPWTGGRLPPAW